MRNLTDHYQDLSINTATFGHRRPIEEIIDLCGSRGIGAIAPWRRDLEDKKISDIHKRLRKNGLKLSGLCRSSYFPQLTAEARRASIEDNINALSIASQLEAQCYVLVVGGLPGQGKDLDDARQQVKDGVNELLYHAKRLGVPLAFEPLHPMTTADRSCLNTLSQALDWCEEIDPGNKGFLGIAIDVYHVWWDPQLQSQIRRACTTNRALAFHVCDWLNPTTDLVLDRGMMGDGVIDVKKIRGWMEDSGYRGPVEVEIFSAKKWWKRSEEEVLDVCIERLLTVC
jgi:sugar phosphate isomerase/epimerase